MKPLHEMTIAELQELRGQIDVELSRRVLGDPLQGIYSQACNWPWCGCVETCVNNPNWRLKFMPPMSSGVGGSG